MDFPRVRVFPRPAWHQLAICINRGFHPALPPWLVIAPGHIVMESEAYRSSFLLLAPFRDPLPSAVADVHGRYVSDAFLIATVIVEPGELRHARPQSLWAQERHKMGCHSVKRGSRSEPRQTPSLGQPYAPFPLSWAATGLPPHVLVQTLAMCFEVWY